MNHKTDPNTQATQWLNALDHTLTHADSYTDSLADNYPIERCAPHSHLAANDGHPQRAVAGYIIVEP